MPLKEMLGGLIPLKCSGRGGVGDRQQRRAGRTRNCSENMKWRPKLSGKPTTVTAHSQASCGTASNAGLWPSQHGSEIQRRDDEEFVDRVEMPRSQRFANQACREDVKAT